MTAFNKLTPQQAELLDILAEEAAEVIVAVQKIKRHGYESYNPHDPNKITNRVHLGRELTELLGVWDALHFKEEVPAPDIVEAAISWTAKLKWTHHIY